MDTEEEVSAAIDEQNGGNHFSSSATTHWRNGAEMPSWVSEPTNVQTPSELWMLEVTDGGSPDGRVVLDRYTTVLGCALNNNYCTVVVLPKSPEDLIDSYHAAVVLDPATCPQKKSSTDAGTRAQKRGVKPQFFLIDLNSLSGTRLNSSSIEKGSCVSLKVGDKISLGNNSKVFRLVRGVAGSGAYTTTYRAEVKMREDRDDMPSLNIEGVQDRMQDPSLLMTLRTSRLDDDNSSELIDRVETTAGFSADFHALDNVHDYHRENSMRDIDASGGMSSEDHHFELEATENADDMWGWGPVDEESRSRTAEEGRGQNLNQISCSDNGSRDDVISGDRVSRGSFWSTGRNDMTKYGPQPGRDTGSNRSQQRDNDRNYSKRNNDRNDSKRNNDRNDSKRNSDRNDQKRNNDRNDQKRQNDRNESKRGNNDRRGSGGAGSVKDKGKDVAKDEQESRRGRSRSSRSCSRSSDRHSDSRSRSSDRGRRRSRTRSRDSRDRKGKPAGSQAKSRSRGRSRSRSRDREKGGKSRRRSRSLSSDSSRSASRSSRSRSRSRSRRRGSGGRSRNRDRRHSRSRSSRSHTRSRTRSRTKSRSRSDSRSRSASRSRRGWRRNSRSRSRSRSRSSRRSRSRSDSRSRRGRRTDSQTKDTGKGRDRDRDDGKKISLGSIASGAGAEVTQGQRKKTVETDEERAKREREEFLLSEWRREEKRRHAERKKQEREAAAALRRQQRIGERQREEKRNTEKGDFSISSTAPGGRDWVNRSTGSAEEQEDGQCADAESMSEAGRGRGTSTSGENVEQLRDGGIGRGAREGEENRAANSSAGGTWGSTGSNAKDDNRRRGNGGGSGGGSSAADALRKQHEEDVRRRNKEWQEKRAREGGGGGKRDENQSRDESRDRDRSRDREKGDSKVWKRGRDGRDDENRDTRSREKDEYGRIVSAHDGNQSRDRAEAETLMNNDPSSIEVEISEAISMQDNHGKTHGPADDVYSPEQQANKRIRLEEQENYALDDDYEDYGDDDV